MKLRSTWTFSPETLADPVVWWERLLAYVPLLGRPYRYKIQRQNSAEATLVRKLVEEMREDVDREILEANPVSPPFRIIRGGKRN